MWLRSKIIKILSNNKNKLLNPNPFFANTELKTDQKYGIEQKRHLRTAAGSDNYKL